MQLHTTYYMYIALHNRLRPCVQCYQGDTEQGPRHTVTGYRVSFYARLRRESELLPMANRYTAVPTTTPGASLTLILQALMHWTRYANRSVEFYNIIIYSDESESDTPDGSLN